MQPVLVDFARGALAAEPFLAMEVFEEAQRMRAAGQDILELCVGEPRFPPPDGVLAATKQALNAGLTRYTDSRGLLELRQAIALDTWRRRGVSVQEDQIIVTSGTSPAMVLVFSLLLEPGDEVLIPTPHYPCVPNIVRVCGGVPVLVPTSPQEGYVVSPAEVRRRITPRTKALVLASPANPTGAVQPRVVVQELAALGVPLVSDEIYDGLLYDGARVSSPLGMQESAFVLDGFSKRYAMTGFRLGYVIVPREAARAVQVLQQNLFISAGHFVQCAGLAALQADADYLARVCADLHVRREVLVTGLTSLGFGINQAPSGAFYVFADATRWGASSLNTARSLLLNAGVAVAPGLDFGQAGEGFLRFSFCAEPHAIAGALERMQCIL